MLTLLCGVLRPLCLWWQNWEGRTDKRLYIRLLKDHLRYGAHYTDSYKLSVKQTETLSSSLIYVVLCSLYAQATLRDGFNGSCCQQKCMFLVFAKGSFGWSCNAEVMFAVCAQCDLSIYFSYMVMVLEIITYCCGKFKLSLRQWFPHGSTLSAKK